VTLYIINVQSYSLCTTLNWPCPKTSFSAALAFVQAETELWPILFENRQFLLPLQQGLALGKFQTAISPRGVVRSTSCLVLRWGFRGRRIEWRYFRYDQIQDGGSVAVMKNSNCNISAADHLIYSAFGSVVWDFHRRRRLSGLSNLQKNARGAIRLVTI